MRHIVALSGGPEGQKKAWSKTTYVTQAGEHMDTDEQTEIRHLREMVAELQCNLDGVTEECVNLLKIKNRLEAEVKRLKAENAELLDRYSKLALEYGRLEAERDALSPYVQHLPDCASGWLEPCDCRLPTARKIGEDRR